MAKRFDGSANDEFLSDDSFETATHYAEYTGLPYQVPYKRYKQDKTERYVHAGKRAVGYIKATEYVKSDTEKRNRPMTADEQRDAIVRYCDEHELALIGWYVDSEVVGVGATDRARNSILYHGVKAPLVNFVVCASSDRLASDAKTYYYYLFVLAKKGVDLVSATERVPDFGGDNGGVYREFAKFAAEQDRLALSTRVSGSLSDKASRGEYCGGRTPFGYKAVGGKLTIVPTEAEVVRKVYYLYTRGMSVGGIAKYLQERGERGRNGGPLSHSTVAGILRQERVYRGYYRRGGTGWVMGVHEPILGNDFAKSDYGLNYNLDDKRRKYPVASEHMSNEDAIKALTEELRIKPKSVRADANRPGGHDIDVDEIRERLLAELDKTDDYIDENE